MAPDTSGPHGAMRDEQAGVPTGRAPASGVQCGETWRLDPLGWMAQVRQRQFVDCYRWFQQVLLAIGMPDFDIPEVLIGGRRQRVQVSVAAQSHFGRLLRFHCDPAADDHRRPVAGRPRVLLCAPLAGHRAVQLRDTVRSLLADADVYVTEWADARDIPVTAGPFRLSDYVRLLDSYLRLLGPSGLHVVAVCQATVPVLAALAQIAHSAGEEPATLTLMGGPIDTEGSATGLGRIAASVPLQWFDTMVMGEVPPEFPGAGRRVYPGFLQFQALVSAQPQRHWSLVTAWMHRHWCDPATARRLASELATHAAVLDLAAEFFLDTVDVMFQRRLLPRGGWRLGGEVVRPGRLRRTRLLTIEAEHDDIAGPGQTHAAQRLCTGLADTSRRAITVARCDHYGLFAGRSWHRVVHPEVRRWIGEAERGSSGRP